MTRRVLYVIAGAMLLAGCADDITYAPKSARAPAPEPEPEQAPEREPEHQTNMPWGYTLECSNSNRYRIAKGSSIWPVMEDKQAAIDRAWVFYRLDMHRASNTIVLDYGNNEQWDTCK